MNGWAGNETRRRSFIAGFVSRFGSVPTVLAAASITASTSRSPATETSSAPASSWGESHSLSSSMLRSIIWTLSGRPNLGSPPAISRWIWSAMGPRSVCWNETYTWSISLRATRRASGR